MPLRDHFRSPVNDVASWEELHGGWPMVIVQQLGRILPDQYVAAPRVHLGSQVEVDAATFERTFSSRGHLHSESDGGAVLAWAPTEPTLTIETELADPDEYEVRIYDAKRGRKLVAAIEIISPSNKDRPESRGQLVSKCAALLRQEVCVVLVDLVTERNFNLYGELLELVGEVDPKLGEDPSPIYAVTCRWHPKGMRGQLKTWNHSLQVGAPLPVLPLWLTEDLAIPLDLEASYEQTCRDLRIA